MKFKEGSIAFLVVNNIKVKRVVVAKATRDFYIVSFYDGFNAHGAIRVRHNRLFASKGEAEATIEERKAQPNTPIETPKTHWDYMM